MKKIFLVILFLAPALSWAAKPKVNPSDYTIVVHVQSSHLVTMCSGTLGHTVLPGQVNCGIKQQLIVIINGKKFELNSKDDLDVVLRPGDYKAKGITEAFPPEMFEYHPQYEFLFPDGTTRWYQLVGESE